MVIANIQLSLLLYSYSAVSDLEKYCSGFCWMTSCIFALSICWGLLMRIICCFNCQALHQVLSLHLVLCNQSSTNTVDHFWKTSINGVVSCNRAEVLVHMYHMTNSYQSRCKGFAIFWVEDFLFLLMLCFGCRDPNTVISLRVGLW